MSQALGHFGRVQASLVTAMLLIAGTAMAQTRTDCEAGISTAKRRLTETADADQRAKLTSVLRHAEQEAGEEQYDECMEALKDAGVTGEAGAGASAEAGGRESDERINADSALPVTVEDAFVPSPGEAEAQLHFFYDHQRPSIDGDKEYGRHLYTPEAEVEIGIVNGFSATIGTNYSLGNAEDAKSGEVEAGAKWNFLQLKDLRPALTLSGTVSVPYGYSSGNSVDTTLSLLGSQPLGSGANAPFLHANLSWTHTFNREEDNRANRFIGVLGVAVPVAESTAIIADVAHEQLEQKGRINNLIEVGVRQEVSNDITLGAGVGAGVGGSVTNFRALIGVQKSF